MTTAAGVGIRRFVARTALIATIAVLAIACIGFLYQHLEQLREARRFAPQGLIVRTNEGGAIHINCYGSGIPTVVLESGLLHGAQDWVLVQTEVSKFARVCSYDRAGYGWSKYRSGPRTSTEIAEELAATLVAAGEQPPYILVGHSLGGILVRRFATIYFGKVAGMVLVDSSHEQQLMHFPPPENSIRRSQHYFRRQIVENEFGIARLMRDCGQYAPRPDLNEETVFLECQPKRWLTALHEIEIFEMPPPLPPAGAFGNLPIAVLTRDVSLESEGNNAAIWLYLQRELAAMSSAGHQQTVKGSSHFIQLDKPEIVVAAVRKVWELASHS